MNVGISLSSSQNPQLWPVCDIVTAHTGIEVNISLQGVIKFLSRQNIKYHVVKMLYINTKLYHY